MGNGSRNLHHRDVIRASIGALPAADTSRAHMSQTSDVIKDCIRGHLNGAFSIGPLQILRGLVIEDISDKNALLAVTDWACHPAVVTVDTIGQIGCQLFQRVGGSFGFREHIIPKFFALVYQGFYDLFAAGRLFGSRQPELSDQVFASRRLSQNQETVRG